MTMRDDGDRGMRMRDDNGPQLGATRRRVGMRDDGFGWGIPAAVIAAVLIIGGLFYMNSGDNRTTTASNDRPAATQTGPAAPSTPVPGPTTTTPAPTR